MINNENKKSYAFKPKTSKIKTKNNDSEINKDIMKEKGENNITKIPYKDNKKDKEKQKKKVLSNDQKNKKPNSKVNSSKKENSKKTFYLNINENKPELTNNKKNRNNNSLNNNNSRNKNSSKKQPEIKFQPRKKKNLNLNSSNSNLKRKFSVDENLTNSSTQSSKQLKTFHMKKDFYIPTVSACLINDNKKNLENSFSSHSSSYSGKGSLKFIKRRKSKLMERSKSEINESYDNKSSINDGFNYEKILDDLNLISNHLNEGKTINYCNLKTKRKLSNKAFFKGNNK